jgi:hypothetical protein
MRFFRPGILVTWLAMASSAASVVSTRVDGLVIGYLLVRLPQKLIHVIVARVRLLGVGIGHLGIDPALLVSEHSENGRRVGGEIVYDLQLAAQRVYGHPVIRLQLAEHFDQLLPGVSLVFEFGIEPVQQHHGDAVGRLRPQLHTVGEGVLRQCRRLLKFLLRQLGRLQGKRRDLLWLPVIEDFEVFLFEIVHGLVFLPVDHHVHLEPNAW